LTEESELVRQWRCKLPHVFFISRPDCTQLVKKFPKFYRNPTGDYHCHKSATNPILSQKCLVFAFISDLFSSQYNLPAHAFDSQVTFPLRSSSQNLLCLYNFSHACCIALPSYLPCFTIVLTYTNIHNCRKLLLNRLKHVVFFSPADINFYFITFHKCILIFHQYSKICNHGMLLQL
jgi:hypothetical protein